MRRKHSYAANDEIINNTISTLKTVLLDFQKHGLLTSIECMLCYKLILAGPHAHTPDCVVLKIEKAIQCLMTLIDTPGAETTPLFLDYRL